MPHRYFTVNDTRIFADIRGDATNPPLLYIHGGPGMGCWDFMHHQADRLAEQLYLIGIDQRGVLRSDPLPDNTVITQEMLMDDFEAIRCELGLESWSILGHSAGGGYALNYAHRHPQTVAAAIYDCPLFDAELSDRYRLPFAADLYDRLGNAELADRCRRVAAGPDPITMATGFPALRGELGAHVDELFFRTQSFVDMFGRDRAASGIDEQAWASGACHAPLMAELYAGSQLWKLDELRQPSMLLHGRYDLVASPDKIQAFRNRTGGPVVAFEDSAHFPQFEEPDAYAQAIIDFIIGRAG